MEIVLEAEDYIISKLVVVHHLVTFPIRSSHFLLCTRYQILFAQILRLEFASLSSERCVRFVLLFLIFKLPF